MWHTRIPLLCMHHFSWQSLVNRLSNEIWIAWKCSRVFKFHNAHWDQLLITFSTSSLTLLTSLKPCLVYLVMSKTMLLSLPAGSRLENSMTACWYAREIASYRSHKSSSRGLWCIVLPFAVFAALVVSSCTVESSRVCVVPRSLRWSDELCCVRVGCVWSHLR